MIARLTRSMAITTRVVLVVGSFIGLPLLVWWIASPMIASLPLSTGNRTMLSTFVLATVTFGGVSGFLVLRDLAEEP